MSDLGKLLRSSKFASLAKPLAKAKNNKFPTHQIVETRKAALDRQEWGLKYALPSKIKSRYITFNDVDNLERLVDFETNGGDHWKRLRFQELGLVPTLEEQTNNPLFNKHATQSRKKTSTRFDSLLRLDPNAPKKEVDSVIKSLEGLRDEFKQWLLVKCPIKLREKKFTISEFTEEAAEFLRAHKSKESINKLDSLRKADGHRVNALGGLSYALKGRLLNNPNGYIENRVVAGRIVSDRQVAIGGFITDGGRLAANQLTKAKDGKEARETVLPFKLAQATIKKDGAIHISSSTISTVRKPPQSNRANLRYTTEDILDFSFLGIPRKL